MKTCCRCNEEKPFDQFNKKGSGHSTYCKQCNKAYLKEHYGANKPYYIAKARRHKNKLKQVVTACKTTPCKDCGVGYPPYVMHFDHLPEHQKLFDIAAGLHNTSLKRLRAEMAKCEVVCANCHAVRTHLRRTDLQGNAPCLPGSEPGVSTSTPKVID